MLEEKDLQFSLGDLRYVEKSLSAQRLIIPDVCAIDLQTGEVELYIDSVSEAAKQFWEAVKRVAGGKE